MSVSIKNIIEIQNIPELKKIEASAGSGKTHVLTTRYLYFLLKEDFKKGNKEFKETLKEILAVTFTNRAAEEMRRRIIERLKKIVFEDQKEIEFFEPYLPKIKNISQRAAYILDALLNHYYSFFNVSTIDSFMARLIRAFAPELEIHPQIEIEPEIEKCINVVINRIFERFPEDPKVKKVLFDYLVYRIKICGKIAWDIRDIVQEDLKNFYSAEKKYLKKINFREKRSIQKFYLQLKELLGIEFQSPTELAKEIPKKRNCIPEELYPQVEKFIDLFSEIEPVALNNFYYLLKEELERYVKEQRELPIGEIEKFIRKLFEKEKVPYIYWKIGEAYKHILIDEFQDTSVIQWKNMEPLIDEAVDRKSVV